MPHDFITRLAQDFGISELMPGQLSNERADVTAHPGQQRIAVPPGKTRFDYEEGEVRHLDSDTVLTDDLPTVDQMTSVGDGEEDKQALRSVLAFADVGCELEIGGSTIPLDPCSYFPIQRRNFSSLTMTTKLPAQAYVIASARSKPFANIVANASHSNRIGVLSGTQDSFGAVGFEAPGTHDNSDFGANARHPALHVQEFAKRTWTVENTSANDAEIRVVGKATHAGPFVDVAPGEQPVTVAAGDTVTLTSNGEAWHVQKLEGRNVTNGNNIDLEAHYAGVNL